ncbi:MAG: hypothetical protein ACAH27_05980 [Xanthobacteraceae bacterium]
MLDSDQLKIAAALIARGWTQHTLARDGDGNATYPESSSAVCWCPLGAFRPQGGDNFTARAILRLAIGIPINQWNDDPARTKEEVLAAFSRAIEIAIYIELRLAAAARLAKEAA